MAKSAKKDTPSKAAAEAKPASSAVGSHDPHHDAHAQPTTPSGMLLQRFKSIDVNALEAADCRALIEEIRLVLAKGKEGTPIDLGDRVKLIRIWNALAWYVEEPDPDDGLAPEVSDASQEPALEAQLEAVKDDALHGPAEEPQSETTADTSLEPEILAGDGASSSALLPEHEASVLVEGDLATAEQSAHDLDVLLEDPLSTKNEATPPDPAIARKRLRMLQDGALMGRILEAGTVVLVYPSDAQHLIDEGIAEMIEQEPLPDTSEVD